MSFITPKQVLLNSIIALNPAASALTLDDLVFGVPTPLTDPVNDTSIVVTCIPNSVFSGNVTVNYKRYALNQFANQLAPILNVPLACTAQQLLDSFNQAYGSDLMLADINWTTPVPATNTTGVQYMLTANPSSVGYTGAVVLTIRLATTDINTVVVNRNLGQLDWPFLS